METTPIAKRRSFTASPLTKKKIVSVMDQLLAFNQRLLEEDEVNPYVARGHVRSCSVRHFRTETEFALICFHVDSLFREHFVGDVGKFQQRFQLYKCQIEFVQTLLVLLKDRLPQGTLKEPLKWTLKHCCRSAAFLHKRHVSWENGPTDLR